MKIDYDSITKDKDNPAWEVGDFIYGADKSLYLVAEIDDLGSGVTGHYFYTLIDLESGYSSESYETIVELQHHTCDEEDRILNGTFKYIEDDK